MPMSDFTNIDHLFESHFAEHEVMVRDRDGLWKRIRPKRRYRFFWIFLLFGIGAAGVSSVYYISEIEEGPQFNAVNNQSPGQSPSSAFILTSSIEKEKHLETSNQQQDDIKKEEGEVLEEQVVQLHHVSLGRTKDGSTEDITSDFFATSIEVSAYEEEDAPTEALAAVAPAAATVERKSQSPFLGLQKIAELPILEMPTALPVLTMKKRKNPLNDCVTFGKGRFFGDLYGIAGLPFETLSTALTAGEQSTYLNEWDQRYSPLLSLSAGINIGYEWRSGLEISGGIEYQRHELQYQTTQTIREVVTIFDPMAYFIIDDQGQRVYIGDEVTAINIYDEVISIGNRSTLLHVPLQVAYPVFRKNNLEIKAVAGGILNFRHNHRGQFLRQDLSLVQVDDANQNLYYTSNIGLSFEGGLHMGIDFNTQWQFYVSPRFRYNNQSYLIDTQPLELRRHFANIRFGVRRRFGE